MTHLNILDHISQGSQEWLDLRKSKITATDATVIVGISPWKTPYQLWLNKIGEYPDQQQTEAMRRGLDLEDEARKTFEKLTGINVRPRIVVSNSNDWMMASLDGLSEDEKEIVEIKCPGQFDHSSAVSGKIPDKYYPQLQHQMAVCEAPRAFYFSYDGHDGVNLEVKRDDLFIEKMIELEKKFYTCMTDIIAPELSERDYVVREDEEWQHYSKAWQEAQIAIKYLEELQEKTREKLLELSRGRNTKGCGISVSKYMRKGNVEYKAIPDFENIDLEKYRKKPIEVWRVA